MSRQRYMKTEHPGETSRMLRFKLRVIALSQELLKILQATGNIAQRIVRRVLLDDEPFGSRRSRGRDHARPVDDSLADDGVAWGVLRLQVFGVQNRQSRGIFLDQR